jgi:hypothetical protein
MGAIVAVVAWRGQQAVQPPLRSSAQPEPPATAVAPAEPIVPAIRYPVAAAQPEPGVPSDALPAIDASDAAMTKALQQLVGSDLAMQVFNLDGFARRVVATVDNLPRAFVPSSVSAVRAAEGLLIVAGDRGQLVLDARNEARYIRYLRLLDRVDIDSAVRVYVHFYPVLQEAYRQLGYPNGYFNDRVIEAIDDMLAAPEPANAVELDQPHVLYTFTEPDLEALSGGQKIVVRLGIDNARHVKAKLRELRSRLTALSR